jgi:hypothetical protein
MTMIPALNVDVAKSMVCLGDRRFPVCALVCPDYGGHPRGERLLGGDSPGGGPWFVPCESGLLIELEVDDPQGLRVSLSARSCHLEPDGVVDDVAYWMPWLFNLHGAEFVPVTTYPVMWYGATPEWTVGLIDRVSRYAYHQPPGPEVEIITAVEALALSDELWDNRPTTDS